MRKLLVLGAGGIIGQHMRLISPKATYIRGRDDAPLDTFFQARQLLQQVRPDVVVNLAGENRVDVVEGHPQATAAINCGLPEWVAEWCDWNGSHLVQVSSQGVFSGDHAPYSPQHIPHAQTEYGAQKAEAERRVAVWDNWTIARVTFVLGVRPEARGRVNPLEQMFAAQVQRQVNDRFFSPSFAHDVAYYLLRLAKQRDVGRIVHLGVPARVSRYDIACLANPSAEIEAVSDNQFPGPSRPHDTTYSADTLWRWSLSEGIEDAREHWKARHHLPS